MPRSRFPRVAPSTRSRPAKVKLPPLKVAIYEYGELIRIIEIPDPRAGLCESMQRDYGDIGLSARPVLDDESPVAPRRRKAVANG